MHSVPSFLFVISGFSLLQLQADDQEAVKVPKPLSFEQFAKRRSVKDLAPEKARVLFDRFDKNKNGFLDAEETQAKRDLRQMRRMSYPIPWQNQIDKADADGDGTIAFFEFAQITMYQKIRVRRLNEIFRHMDRDRDGRVVGAEFALARERQNRPPNLDRMDRDQDGKVSREEFDLAPMVVKLPKKRKDFIFGRLDKNGDGQLSAADGPVKN